MSDECESVSIKGLPCHRGNGHSGAHIHEFTNGQVVGWGLPAAAPGDEREGEQG